MADAGRRRRRREQLLRKPRIFRDHTQPLETFDDEEIYRKFRLPRDVIMQLTDELTDQIQHANRLGSLPPLMQVLLTLRFYASGAFQDVCGELISVSQHTASRTIRRVTAALLHTVNQWICFPNEEEASTQKRKFAERHGFPNVFGCIDGTHVAIQAPAIDEWQYVNRKNYHSINVQVRRFVSECYALYHSNSVTRLSLSVGLHSTCICLALIVLCRRSGNRCSSRNRPIVLVE